jgi:hypothetical protein
MHPSIKVWKGKSLQSGRLTLAGQEKFKGGFQSGVKEIAAHIPNSNYSFTTNGIPKREQEYLAYVLLAAFEHIIHMASYVQTIWFPVGSHDFISVLTLLSNT